MSINGNNSVVTICNSALIKVGGCAISSIDDESKEARICKEQYRKHKEALLSEHTWNFAKKRILLTPSPTKTAWGDLNIFALPSDCTRPIATSLDDCPGAYEVEGAQLISKESEIGILYISKETDESLFSEAFCELLALRIAADICYSIVQSRTLKLDLKGEYETYLAQVRSFNGQEGGQKTFTNEGSGFLQSRY